MQLFAHGQGETTLFVQYLRDAGTGPNIGLKEGYLMPFALYTGERPTSFLNFPGQREY